MPRRSSSSTRPIPGRGCLWLALAVCAVGARSVDAQGPAPLELIAPLDNDTGLGFFVANSVSDDPALRADAELCTWALDDWVRHSQGRIRVTVADEGDALIRVYFDALRAGQYGEMRPIRVSGRRGAEVYVRADTEALGPDIASAVRADPLLRETIVYLTCLHEIGHALGMVHTADFEDVMYFFGFGGDIDAFFGRYRARLERRRDIVNESGLSGGDIAQLLAAYPDD
ncbi:MAG: hypothetical protein PVH89_08150 [Gammaproteobacteria bacterium]|jgi:hypothetical protein